MIAGIISGVLGIPFVLGGLVCLVLQIWMLVHAITNKGLSDGERIAWVLVVILMPCLGSILYFFIGRPKAIG